MIVDWIRIKNFRSIKDSGKLYFNRGITLLAGKNESGKSNVLKALQAFTKDSFDKDDDFPLDVTNIDELEPEVTVSFLIEDRDLDRINKKELKKEASRVLILTRYASYTEFWDGSFLDVYCSEFESRIKALSKEITSEINNIDKLSETKFGQRLNDDDFLESMISTVDSMYQLFESEVPNEENRQVALPILDKIKKLANEYKIANKQLNNSYEVLKRIIPKFVYFNSFEDIIPNYITTEKDFDLPIIERFFRVAKIDGKSIFSETNSQKRKIITDKTSAMISGNFMEYYTQDTVSLKINLDGEKLNFFIYGSDNEKPFQPKQRSQGLQWFLAFYLTLQAEGQDNGIIMIDEPGMYLHAKAQEDLLRLLEELSKNNQIVFTTHSQWLIDPNHLERVRLVIKEDDSTLIENKIHKGADKDTMKPIISAIGLNLSNNLISYGSINILVEGYSDYYYLQAMKKYFTSNNLEYNDLFIYPCLGASQILQVVSIFIGRETEFKVLVDNDKAGRQTARKLIEECLLDENKVIFTTNQNAGDCSIEDLFSPHDFNKYVLSETEDNAHKKSGKGLDKILIAKKFNEKVRSNAKEIVLSEETLKNFTNLFDRFYTVDKTLSPMFENV